MTKQRYGKGFSDFTPARMTGRQAPIAFLLLGTGFMLSVDFSILNIPLPQVGAAIDIRQRRSS